MACVGLYSSISYSHDCVSTKPDDETPLPLDPCTVAGKAALGMLRSIGVALDLKFVFSALRWLNDPSELLLGSAPTQLNNHSRVIENMRII